MLKLGGGGVKFVGASGSQASRVLRVSTDPNRLHPLRTNEALLATNHTRVDGFAAYLTLKRHADGAFPFENNSPCAVIPDDYDYLTDGDIIRLRPDESSIRVLYRRNSHSNAFLLTERCNHYCLMCSQPPKNVDDSWIVNDVLAAIPLIDRATQEIGFTGGEPTLLEDDFFRILQTTKSYLPETGIHILSNGRRFSDEAFAKRYSELKHPDMMVGIPIYSDLSTVHDYVVQSDGAFDETIRGILNLKKHGQKVEIRVVVHKQTSARLPQLAEFLVRNLTFVDHIALMGLEMTGFTRANLDKLWIDPADYKNELYMAATHLADAGVNTSIYNHQLCLLDPRIAGLARKSISDWKNEYMPECGTCSRKQECGGFFSSAKLKYSSKIRPFA